MPQKLLPFEEMRMSDIHSYAAPRSLDEAAELLRAANVTILAGGTDLMPQSKAGRFKFQPTLMNIRHIPELHGITQADGSVRIGALTTITELYTSALVRERFNALWQACDHFASDPNGALTTRTMPLADFFVAPGRTKREASELVTAVEIPLPPVGFVSEFFKFGTRPALDISVIAIGLGATRDGKILRNVRVAFGAVAPRPIRAPQTEAALEGKALDDKAIEAAVTAALNDVHPISDVRASDWYRRELVQNMLRRMLAHVRDH
jgi:xanthine dehydrogenase FAD-binding subunit